MRGSLILLVFFSTFTVASILIPSPLFPGNVLAGMIGEAAEDYATYLSAMFNGIFYGAILWLAFLAISRRLVSE